MEGRAKEIFDALFCPICKGKVDLIGWLIQRAFAGRNFNFACVDDYKHYSIWFDHWSDNPKIERESLTIDKDNNKYHIIKSYYNDSTMITIETTIKDELVPEVMHIDKDVINFQSDSIERILDKIGAIKTFG